MAATVIEETGRRGDARTRSRKYLVKNATSEDNAILAVEAAAPSLIGSISRTDVRVTESNEIEDWYRAEAIYSKNDKDPPERTDVTYRFSFQARSVHIYQALAQVGYAPDNDKVPDMHGAINVINDNGKLKVEGLDLPIPSETFSLSYTINKTFAPTYQTSIQYLAGKVNDRPWRTLPARSVMLVRAGGGQVNNDDWTIDLGFGHQAPQQNIPVGDITVPSKHGFDYLWPYYVTDVDADANALIKKPRAAYVAQVYETGDFNQLDTGFLFRVP